MSKLAGDSSQEYIKRSRAADLVCDTVYSDADAYDRKKHRNAIGTRITRAFEAGELTLVTEGFLKTEEFLGWALDRYPSLRKKLGLPRQLATARLNASLPAMRGRISGVTIPASREELEARYREVVCELQQSRQDNQKLQDEIERLEPYRLREEQRERETAAWSEEHSTKIKKGLVDARKGSN